MTRTPAKADALRAAGAEPAVADAFDREDVRNAVMRVRPTVVVHQITAIAKMRNLKHFDDEFALTNRLRTKGTQHLLAAAQEAGARRFVAQSYTGWPNARNGDRVKNQEDPLDTDPPKARRRTLESIRELEQMVTGAAGLAGIVLRYGSFYGPGTLVGDGGDIIEMVRQRMFPIFGDGGGVWSFIHTDDAANATRMVIEEGPAGIYNIVDDESAEVSAWLPELAQAIGAKPPLHLPAWLGRLVIGDAGLSMMTEVRGSSNAKAKRLLGWRPAYASWRDGFRRGLSGELSKVVSLKAS
jgi:nucleoside-diphosphate-sugar epimerase